MDSDYYAHYYREKERTEVWRGLPGSGAVPPPSLRLKIETCSSSIVSLSTVTAPSER